MSSARSKKKYDVLVLLILFALVAKVGFILLTAYILFQLFKAR